MQWERVSQFLYLFIASRRRLTRGALVTGVQTCALPIGRTCWRSRLARHDKMSGHNGPSGRPAPSSPSGARWTGRGPATPIGIPVRARRTVLRWRLNGANRSRSAGTDQLFALLWVLNRSAERLVGEESVSPCTYRDPTLHQIKQ